MPEYPAHRRLEARISSFAENRIIHSTIGDIVVDDLLAEFNQLQSRLADAMALIASIETIMETENDWGKVLAGIERGLRQFKQSGK